MNLGTYQTDAIDLSPTALNMFSNVPLKYLKIFPTG